MVNALFTRSAVLFFLLLPFLFPRLECADISGVVDPPEQPRERRQAIRYGGVQPGAVEPKPEPPAVVYLLNDQTRNLPLQVNEPYELTQRGLQFFPPVLPIQVGSAVRFPNLDDTFHNVFSYSPAKTFDLGRYKQGEDPPRVVFEKPGIVQVFCEVHEHMRSTILVLETPYFTTTDTQGRFQLADVTPGNYTLVIWKSVRNQREVAIEVTGKEDLELDLSKGRDP